MSTLERWLGGSPLAVLLKLLFLSLLVGIIMAALGLTPMGLVARLTHALRSLFGLGFDAVRDFGRFILTGAMIVLPVWLILRVAGARR